MKRSKALAQSSWRPSGVPATFPTAGSGERLFSKGTARQARAEEGLSSGAGAPAHLPGAQSRWRRQVPARSQPEAAGVPGGVGDSGGAGAAAGADTGGSSAEAEGGTGEVSSIPGRLLS